MVIYKIKKDKKAQAAMEFLMTYGWALLVVLIAISALAYFGLLNPSRFLPEKAELCTGLFVPSFSFDSGTDQQIDLLVNNGLGKKVYDIQIEATQCDGSSMSPTGTDIPIGGTVMVSTDCEISDGIRVNTPLKITYNTKISGETLTHSCTGRVIVSD